MVSFHKISLFLLTFFAFTNLSITAKETPLICSLEVLASSVRKFSNDGQNGNQGRNGRQGRDGGHQNVFVEDSPVRIDLSGTDGEDGEDGRSGSSPRCGNQPRNVDYDLQAANGGDGGRGGDGGNGGNGGSVKLYYTDLASLNNLYLRLEAGRSGRGGVGGYGTRGCRCRVRSWEKETCTGTPESANYSCKKEQFRCRDGSDGRDGRDGSDGRDGDRGKITLIPQLEPLPPEQNQVSLSLSELTNQTHSLSKHFWNTRQGANSLLASGSIVANEYREFRERIEQEFQLVWDAERSINHFYDQTVQVALGDNQEIAVNFPEDLWVKGTTVEKDNLTQFVIADAIMREEATQLAKAEFNRDRANLSVSLVDLAGISDKIETSFRVKYRASTSDPWRNSRPTDYRTHYEDIVPEQFVNRENNRFTVNIGQLPINSQYLQSRTAVEIEVIAIRSFANNFTEQSIMWRGEIN